HRHHPRARAQSAAPRQGDLDARPVQRRALLVRHRHPLAPRGDHHPWRRLPPPPDPDPRGPPPHARTLDPTPRPLPQHNQPPPPPAPPAYPPPTPAKTPPPPVILGGHAKNVLERIAEWGDGWLPNRATPEDVEAARAKLDRLAKDANRNPAALTISVFGQPADK